MYALKGNRRSAFSRLELLSRSRCRSALWAHRSVRSPRQLSVHLNGKPSTPRRHTRKRGDAGQKRRVALDKVEKLLRGDAEQSCVCLVLGHLNGRDPRAIHPAEGLEIAAVVENRYVLANTKFSGFRHRCIHHFLCQLIRDAVFLHHVSHWTPFSI